MSAPANAATCGCCAGLSPATPLSVSNRPGLNALVYRVGTHGGFKASLLARIATSSHPALQQLTSRRDDDLAIALCDAWATVADVLTFYQERIANESYLRTASERRSVRELARLIDYALRPGVAASTHLAFTMETAPGSPAETDVPTGTKVMSVPGPGEKAQTFETVEDMTARGAWNQFQAKDTMAGAITAGITSLYLAGASLDLKVGDRLLFMGAGRAASFASSDWAARTLTSVEVDRDTDRTLVTWSGALPALGAPVTVRVLRQHAALVGATAPDPRNLASDTITRFNADIERGLGGAIIDWKFTVDGDNAYLDGAFDRLLPGDFVLLDSQGVAPALFDVTAATVLTQRAWSLSARATRVTLQSASSLAAFHGANLRGTTAWFLTQPLALADVAITDPVEGGFIDLDTTATDLPAGRLLLVTGTDADSGEAAGETVTLLRTDTVAGLSRLVLNGELVHRYVPDTVLIRGNVSPATHGETVREVLGSGDGSKPFLRMKLRQPPLTYVSARTPTGSESTLELRVNGLLWEPARTLFDAGPVDRAYAVRHEEDGGSVIEFGDGRNGARLPTGQENISAVYRKGIGKEGNLDAGQLTQLITRPLGIKDVRNPLAASGADDAESVDDARANCTLTIHTLERIVSLQDYEDYARAFAGVAKALATWFWDGRRRRVLLTIAGPDGASIDPASTLPGDLIATIREWGDPQVPVDVRSYVPASFAARVAIAPSPDELRDVVHERVRVALLDAFGFAARRFAQAVTIDDVMAVAQSAQGVYAVNVTRLTRDDLDEVEPRLAATGPIVLGGEPIGAELLTLGPDELELTDLA